MKNMSQLRTKLCAAFDDLHSGKIEASAAKELTNMAGKIIASVNTELKACEINKTSHRIEFLAAEPK
jgi:hypothetical protein